MKCGSFADANCNRISCRYVSLFIPARRLAMHYLLMYDLVPDYLERRGGYRDAHLKLAWAAAERGELLLAGALAEPTDGAVLLFEGASSAVAEAFAEADPYVLNGLVTGWRVREWTTVVGEYAAKPVRV
jgi:uncharacterized protein YciI